MRQFGDSCVARPVLAPSNRIDTERSAKRFRERIVDHKDQRILVSRLEGSAQEGDLSVPPNCSGFGRIRHFRRETANGWPDNPLPIDPAAYALGIDPREIARAQVFQAAACAWRCWYCYVPFEMLAGDEQRSGWLSAAEMIALYLSEPERPAIIDISGGSPDLVPEWVLWTIDALREAELENPVYLWSDDNLSTDYYFEMLSRIERERIATFPRYSRVCCFKGFDAISFTFNTRAEESEFGRQFERFARYLDAGLDLYAYVTLTGPTTDGLVEKVNAFVDRMQAISRNLPLRTVPLQIQPFTPLLARRQPVDVATALKVQERAISAWQTAIGDRFSHAERSTCIAEVTL